MPSAIAAACALLLLPGILILRGPLWLAAPASLAVWLTSWLLTAAVGGRESLVTLVVSGSLGLGLVALPRLGKARCIAIVTVAAAVALAVGLGTRTRVPFSTSVAAEATAAHLLAWHDGLPLARVPLGVGAFHWPGGVAPLLADALLMGATMGAALWAVAAAVLLAFVAVVALPADGARPRPVRLGAAPIVGLAGVVADPGLLLAGTLVLAAMRLKREKPGGASTFGGAVLLTGAMVVALPLAWRGLPAGWGRGPSVAESRLLSQLDRAAPRTARVCAERIDLEPWIGALAARPAGPGCTWRIGATSFHTDPPNLPRVSP